MLVVLLDDMGFGATSAFGGPCQMPTAERLAQNGLKFNRFHTTALCSPTRAALLTGRNHHSVGMAAITEIATAFPGTNSARPLNAAPMAEMLKLNGYNTACFGKWHQLPVWEASVSGPYDQWPTGEGFEKYFGFLGGETDNYNPTLFEGTTPIDTPDEPGYHLSEDLATRTIGYIREQQAMTPDKPFFTYLSFGATHAPHHAPPEYVQRYAGQFDHGWDRQRELTLQRQREMGVVSEDAELTEHPKDIPAWDGLDDDRHRLFSRMMEGYAGFATHTDEQVGRVVDAIEDLGILDNTIIVYILGDNGASGEGGPDGSLNEYAAYNLVEETVEEMITHIDEIGSDRLFNHYMVGWAHAMNTPYQRTKQIASHWGGTRTGMIVHWPAGIEARGGIRDQFTHVIDVAPTILQAAGIPEPTSVNGVAQKPMEGHEFCYAFDAPEVPERLTRLKELFLIEGAKYQVFPLDDRKALRFNTELVGRPDLMRNRTTLTLYPGMMHLGENTLPDVKNRSHAVHATITTHTDSDGGELMVQGGRFGGWALYLHRGVPTYVHNWVGLESYFVRGDSALPAGDTRCASSSTTTATVRAREAPAGSGSTAKSWVRDASTRPAATSTRSPTRPTSESTPGR